jgi:hypothetical protein
MASPMRQVVRGPQAELPVTGGEGSRGGKSAAERAREYRKNQKLKKQGLEQRAAFATMQQPGALPVQTTEPDDKGDPARWSSVPTIEPAPPDPNAPPPTNPDGTPAAPGATPTGPQPVVTAAGKRRPPTEAEEASAEKLGEKLARFWDAGGQCAQAIYDTKIANDPEAPTVLKVWMGVLVKEWRDKETRKIVKAAGAELAIKWGIATTLSPPPEVIVLGAVALSGLAHLGAISMDKEKAEAKQGGGASSPPIDANATEVRDEGAARASDEDENPSERPYAQSWSQFGKLPKGASS